MKKVFVSGSRSIRYLHKVVLESLEKIIDSNMKVLIGDAKGVDKLVQDYLSRKKYSNVIIYTVCENPRNLSSSNFQVKKIYTDKLRGREKQEKKDEEMTKDSDYLFVIWDGKSEGSFKNILRGLKNNKKIKVYYVKEKRFLKKEELTETNIKEIYLKNKEITKKQNKKTKSLKQMYISHQFIEKN